MAPVNSAIERLVEVGQKYRAELSGFWSHAATT